MDFGKLLNVDNVNWELPALDPDSTRFLEGLAKIDSFKV